MFFLTLIFLMFLLFKQERKIKYFWILKGAQLPCCWKSESIHALLTGTVPLPCTVHLIPFSSSTFASATLRKRNDLGWGQDLSYSKGDQSSLTFISWSSGKKKIQAVFTLHIEIPKSLSFSWPMALALKPLLQYYIEVIRQSILALFLTFRGKYFFFHH